MIPIYISIPTAYAGRGRPRHMKRGLEQTLDAQKEVEAEQREGGAAPDHQSAFPSQRTGHVLLAAPGDQKSFVVCALPQDDRRERVESIVCRAGFSLGPVSVERRAYWGGRDLHGRV